MVVEAIRTLHRYLAYGVCFLLLGITTSSAVPLASIYLKTDLGASNRALGLIAFVGLASAVMSLLVGKLSDRIRQNSWLVRGTLVWIALGWIVLSASRSLTEAVVGYAMATCLLGTANAQLFMMLSTTVETRQESNPNTIFASVRGTYSLGYVIGPIGGTLLGTSAGLRTALMASGLSYGLCALSTFLLPKADLPRTQEVSSAAPDRKRHGILSVLLFTFIGGLVLSGDSLKGIYLPIYVTQDLQSGLLTFGSLMAVSAVLEIVVMPLIGFAGDRIGLFLLVCIALVMGVFDFALLGFAGTLWVLYVVQILHVFVLCVTLGVGPVFFQRFLRAGRSTASSAFFAGQALATVVAGLVGSIGSGSLGLPRLFWVPAGFFVIALAAIRAMRFRLPRDSDAARVNSVESVAS